MEPRCHQEMNNNLSSVKLKPPRYSQTHSPSSPSSPLITDPISARCQSEGSRLKGCEKDLIGETNSLSGESLGTSIQVQMGNSVDIFSVQDERTTVSCRAQQKEDWDDSTIGSNISKLRIQNRFEASTRCERALAYAFSQQLRICPKKRGVKLNAREPNMGWSWLERWMATCLPKSSSVESHTSKQVEPIYKSIRSQGIFRASKINPLY
ncbi:hypothetical protein UlMin_000536 [Ulmus minor]